MFAQRGRRGEIRAGSSVAARFGAWSLVRPDEVLGCDAATVGVESQTVIDTFLFGHGSLDLWLDCGSAWWIWRDVAKIGETSWRTRGGKPEIRLT